MSPELQRRIDAAAQRFRSALERTSCAEVRSSILGKPGPAGSTSSLERLAVAFAVTAAAANPMLSMAHARTLDSIKPVAFVSVNGDSREVLPHASVAQISQAVSEKLGGSVQSHEVYSYLVYAHGMDWNSIVSCHTSGEEQGSEQLVAIVNSLKDVFAAADQWASKRVGDKDIYKAEARFNYMLASSEYCRKWSPGVAVQGDVRQAIHFHAHARAFKGEEAKAAARGFVNEAGFFPFRMK